MNAPAPGAALPQRPLTVLIAALGGEGGGVLSEWLVDTATHEGLPVQSTSIPGVAQRTGATTYYIEIYPARLDALGGRRPVLALTPSPGNVDLMVASELLEAGRAMHNGYVSPDRTTLVASTHRIYAIAEKSAMGDGRFDTQRLRSAAQALAKQRVLFDMSAAAAQAGTVISAVMFGAIAGSGVLPLSRAACEAAIGRAGKGAQASLRGFALGYAHAADPAPGEGETQRNPAPAATMHGLQASEMGETQRNPALAATTHGPQASEMGEAQRDPALASRARQPHDALMARIRSEFPAALHAILEPGVVRLVDYQDNAYAALYLDRLTPILAAERAASSALATCPITSEIARHLALWMSYEDLIRVADLKTRRTRLERVRAEVRAKPHEPVHVIEYLKPGVQELCSVLPESLARPLLAWAARRGRSFNVGMHLRTTSVGGFLLMRAMAWLRPLRRRTSRFHAEQRLIERWIAALRAAIPVHASLALGITECARLIKGYGDTHQRGTANFLRLFDSLVDGAPQLTPEQRAAALHEACAAALADPEGRQLRQALAGGEAKPASNVKPVVWVSPRRSERLSADTD